MPQRNGQNPIKGVKGFTHDNTKFTSELNIHNKAVKNLVVCPNCKAEVPPKPGFRISALKCPKCGASMRKVK